METTIAALPTMVVGGQIFELVWFFKDEDKDKDGKFHIIGTEMIERTEALGSMADQSRVELFLTNQKDIPVEGRKLIPVFAGAIKRGPRGYCGVAYLWWCDISQQWIQLSRWLGFGFGDFCRLVRPKR